MSTSEIKPPAGIKWESRTAVDLATDAARRTTENVWRCVQRKRNQRQRDPEKYDLLRARMGGWTKFFVTMFPARPAQHERRAVGTAEGGRHE